MIHRLLFFTYPVFGVYVLKFTHSLEECVILKFICLAFYEDNSDTLDFEISLYKFVSVTYF